MSLTFPEVLHRIIDAVPFRSEAEVIELHRSVDDAFALDETGLHAAEESVVETREIGAVDGSAVDGDNTSGDGTDSPSDGAKSRRAGRDT